MPAQQDIELSLPGTATLTAPLFVADRPGFLSAADWSAQGATDGTKTVQLKNNTQNVNLTGALTVSGLAALARTPFVMASTNKGLNKNDVIVAIYTVSVAGSVGPGEATVGMTIDDPLGVGYIGG